MRLAFLRKRCAPRTLRAASRIPSIASDDARRILPLLPARSRCSRLAQLRPPAPMELADEPQSNAPWLSSEALHPWHASSGFGHPTDSSGRSAPNFAAASRSLAKLLACSKSGRLHQMKPADKQHAKPSRPPSAALHPRHSSSGSRHPIDSFGRCVPILAAASRSSAKLLACSKSGRLHQMKLADKQHAKPSRPPSAALQPGTLRAAPGIRSTASDDAFRF